ncbi:MAG: hypothetical protein LBR80_04235 [Deltaproteobacteria bacterium]|jgi:hypothetical protein|nr:hypothetical protein [Deltaproteobacteria bacterium]
MKVDDLTKAARTITEDDRKQWKMEGYAARCLSAYDAVNRLVAQEPTQKFRLPPHVRHKVVKVRDMLAEIFTDLMGKEPPSDD